MNRTKMIYFLSAMVLIIGCYALNLSYSLFVQTEEKEVVNSTVPSLAADLSLTSVNIEASSEVIIKEVITNTGNTGMNYAINSRAVNFDDNTETTQYEIKTVNDIENTFLSIGTVEVNESNTTYFMIKNNSDKKITVYFDLQKKYSTLKNDLVSNINSEEPYIAVASGVPYSDNKESLAYHIIKNQIDTFGNEVSSTESNISLEDVNFVDEGNVKLLPLTLSDGELNVPSPTEFTDVETQKVGLYKTQDDYGTSYYYRGANSTNYVSFAGFTWRIVRINGDGSIRLILDKILDEAVDSMGQKLLSTLGASNVKSYFNNNNNSNAYIGYVYGNPDGVSYYDTHKNMTDSTVKTKVDKFYEYYLIQYENYISDTLFCGDKTSQTNGTTYSAYNRLVNSPFVPSLKCASRSELGETDLTDEELSFSRYTANLTSISNGNEEIQVNNSLTYSIALLSADEVAFAGGRFNRHSSCYLFDTVNDTGWWTMTPYNNASIFIAFNSGTHSLDSASIYPSSLAIRPVINLRKDVLVDNGNGSSGTPYTVKLPTE